MEPENQAFEKEHHLPNLKFWVPCWFFRRCTTVDERNPAPVDMENIPFFIGFHR